MSRRIAQLVKLLHPSPAQRPVLLIRRILWVGFDPFGLRERPNLIGCPKGDERSAYCLRNTLLLEQLRLEQLLKCHRGEHETVVQTKLLRLRVAEEEEVKRG